MTPLGGAKGNDYAKQNVIEPKTFSIGVGRSFSYRVPGNSLTVVRMRAGR